MYSRPIRPSPKRTGRSALPVPVSKHVAAHLFQTCKKEDYIMVHALPTISKAGAESANEDNMEMLSL